MKWENMLVCLGFSFHSRSFHSNEDVTNTGKAVQILTYARHIWPLSSDGSLACHTSVTSWPPNSADRERILLFETGFYTTVYLQKDIYTHKKTAQWFFTSINICTSIYIFLVYFLIFLFAFKLSYINECYFSIDAIWGSRGHTSLQANIAYGFHLTITLMSLLLQPLRVSTLLLA